MLQCSRGKQICIPRCADLQIFAPQLDDYFSSAPYHSKVRRPPDNLRRAYPTEFRRQYVEGDVLLQHFFLRVHPAQSPRQVHPDQPTKSQWTYCSHLSNKAPLFETAIKLWPVAQVY